MTALIEVLASGLALGAIYALVGLSLNLVYATTRVISFAQGDVGMVAVVSVLLLSDRGLPVVAAIPIGLGVAMLVALAVDLIAVRPLRQRQGSPNFGWIVTTLGAALVIENLAAVAFGTESHAFPQPFGSATFDVMGATVTSRQVGTIVSAVLLVLALAWVLRSTSFGRAARAIADNTPMSSAMGVDTDRVRSGVIALAAVVMAVAAFLSATQTFANVFIGTPLLLNGMAAIVLAGLGNVRGGLAGGLVLGVIYALAGRYAPSVVVPYVPFVILLLWITFSPRALESWRRARGRRRLTTAGSPR